MAFLLLQCQVVTLNEQLVSARKLLCFSSLDKQKFMLSEEVH